MTKFQRSSRNLKSILIDPFKQIKLGVYVLALTFSFLCLSGLLFIWTFNEQYQHVIEIFKVVNPQIKWQLITNDIFYTNILRLGLLFLGFVGVLFFIIFRMTHKYYGPLVSIGRFVESVTAGDYSRRIVIRKGDELQELVNSLNSMAETLGKRHDETKPSGLKSKNV